jgi:AraC family transcriptional regulator of arabinose operon
MPASPLQTFARLCFRLLAADNKAEAPSQAEVAAVREVVGGHFNAEELVQLSFSVRNMGNFHERRRQLLTRWKHLLTETFSDEDAQAFLDDYFKNPDHPFESNSIFDNGLVASRTRTERGNFSDSEGSYSGNMPCWTLHFTLEGRALFISEDREWDVLPGDLMLFRPNATYRYGLHPSAELWDHCWVLFQPRSHWNHWLEWQGGTQGIQHMHLPAAKQRKAIQATFERLLALKDESPPYLKELQHTALEEMLIRAAGFRENQESPRDGRIEQACRFMEDNLARPFHIEDVAAHCNLSPSRLSHLFKDHMGVSVKAWINTMRLQEARRRLTYSGDNISQIAYAVGFEDANLFAKNFKKNMGCSPREFRKTFAKR